MTNYFYVNQNYEVVRRVPKLKLTKQEKRLLKAFKEHDNFLLLNLEEGGSLIKKFSYTVKAEYEYPLDCYKESVSQLEKNCIRQFLQQCQVQFIDKEYSSDSRLNDKFTLKDENYTRLKVNCKFKFS